MFKLIKTKKMITSAIGGILFIDEVTDGFRRLLCVCNGHVGFRRICRPFDDVAANSGGNDFDFVHNDLLSVRC